MSHAELVRRAERWLLNTAGCGFVLAELCSSAPEIPDAIGFKHAWSYLIECKTTRSDFYADASKSFRKAPESGMGNFRYYLTPPDLIDPAELPPRWGLLEAFPTRIRLIRKANVFASYKIAFNDRRILCSALRRVQLRNDLCKIYEPFGRTA